MDVAFRANPLATPLAGAGAAVASGWEPAKTFDEQYLELSSLRLVLLGSGDGLCLRRHWVWDGSDVVGRAVLAFSAWKRMVVAARATTLWLVL